MTGMVKSYNRKGFGFIMCQAIEQDIYFSRESLHPNLQTSDLAGEQIQFEIHRFADGKLQARNLRALGDVSDFKGSSYGANREYGAGVRAQFFNSRGPGGLQDEDRSRDWYCKSCGERNFMKRFECFKCKAPKPPEAPGDQPVAPPVPTPPPKRTLSPHAGSRAMREMYKQGLLGPGAAAAAAAAPAKSPSKSRSKRSASSSSSSSSRQKKRRKKKKKHKKNKRSSSSDSRSSDRSKSSVRSAHNDPKDEEDDEKPKETNPEIEKAKAEALEKLMKLKEVEPRENRLKEFRILLRKWHPDKNPDQQEVATAVFQFLQKGKLLIESG